MCGICGKVVLNGGANPANHDSVRRMMNVIRHRGPDADGFYGTDDVALGHRRLDIIDLATGDQPIFNEDRTVCVMYNGEIYNYRELREFLLSKGHQFRTKTDTEVIVHLYEELGDDCVARFFGMFAFALWDERKHRLLLARDRVGIKPLYYAVTGKSLVFASEAKAILGEGDVQAEVEPAALDVFLTFYYTPGNTTLFRGIRKLEPGHYLTVEGGQVRTQRYWDLEFTGARAHKSMAECEAELTELTAQTVKDHMIADVPVGVLLSGGVDSSAMLSFATEASDRPLSTFTIGFHEPGVTDERPYAHLAAERCGSRHFDMTISSRDFQEWLPNYAWHMDEPVCEPPAVALYFVSKLAREHVTVLLSGEGGDEAFAGYQTYRNLCSIEWSKRMLGPVSKAMAAAMSALPISRIAKYAPYMRTPLESYYYSRASSPWTYFNQNRRELYSEAFLGALRGQDATALLAGFFERSRGWKPLERMLYVDTKTWLPDDLLIKADKMTMANSLELRVPLLDHRVLEFAASLPPRYKLRGWSMKHLLKRVLRKRVPKEILKRKKTGFPVPYVKWLRQDCRDYVWSVLTDSRTRQRGYFRPASVEKLLEGNDRNGGYAKEVFSLLVLELWHRSFCDRAGQREPERPVLRVGAAS